MHASQRHSHHSCSNEGQNSFYNNIFHLNHISESTWEKTTVQRHFPKCLTEAVGAWAAQSVEER